MRRNNVTRCHNYADPYGHVQLELHQTVITLSGSEPNRRGQTAALCYKFFRRQIPGSNNVLNRSCIT